MYRLAKTLLIAALFLFPGAGSVQGRDTAHVELTYRPVTRSDGGFAAIDIALRFPGSTDGVTHINLPGEWGGFDQLYAQLSNFRAEGATLTTTANPMRMELRHVPGAPILLRYRIENAGGSERLTGSQIVNDYRPIVRPTYFHLIGDAVLAKPAHLPGETPASFRIEAMPAGAAFASDLEHRALTLDKLVESVAVGGDFRLIDAGGGARLAVRGRFDARDDHGWIDSFRKIAAASTGYWNSKTGPYLVTILAFEPSGPGATSIGGTGRGDAFAFFATTNAEPAFLDRIMAHEMAHSWVNGRIGGFAKEGPEAEQYWLSEGFTDFTSWRALARSGFWTPEHYFGEFNTALAEYDRSPLRATPNAAAAALHWTDEDARKLAYQRGMLIAHWADHRLASQRRPRSMRNLLHVMQARGNPPGESAITLFRKTANKYGLAIDAALARFIGAGEPIPLPIDFLAACGTLKSFERPEFHRGFDIEATRSQGGTIAGVIEGSAAWRAGMRNGMKLIGRSGGEIGDSMTEIAYDVEDRGEKRTLRYLPQGSKMQTVRQFETADLTTPDARRRCIAALSR